MKVLITGSSRGMGKAMAIEFLNNGHEVYGFDILDSTINHNNYKHYIIDVYKSELPEIDNINIIINNAGIQTQSLNDIHVNLEGTIRVTEKYAFHEGIVSVLMVASASATTGSEFPHYAASKGGIKTYARNVALRLAKYNATCNSISPGGVYTDINEHIMKSEELLEACLNETILHRWSDCEEIAKWAYFVTVVNKSMTGEDLLMDNGEHIKANFIW